MNDDPMSSALVRISDLQSVPRADAYLAAETRRLSEETRCESEATENRNIVAVVGAGTMGRTIAAAVGLAGFRTILVDRDPAQLQSAKAAIGRWTSQAALATEIGYTANLADIANADIVVESVFEDLAAKIEVLAAIARHVRADSLITTNSSSLDIDRLATASARAENFLGTHFLLPAHRIPVLEVVAGIQTSSFTVSRALAFADRLGKLAVPAGNCDGYIGNRLFDRLWQEALYLVEEGAKLAAIDAALEQWGMALGPFRTLDRIGNDLIYAACRRRATERPGIVLPDLIRVIHEAGRQGSACGRGWYDYAPGSRHGESAEAVEGLIDGFMQEHDRKPRHIDAEEIVARCVLSVVLEGEQLIADRIARSEGDIDVLLTRGYGFPEASGGPMHLARAIGPRARAELLTHHGRHALRGAIRDMAELMDQTSDN